MKEGTKEFEDFERWFESEYGKEPLNKYEREQLTSEFVELGRRWEIAETKQRESNWYHSLKGTAIAIWEKLRGDNPATLKGVKNADEPE